MVTPFPIPEQIMLNRFGFLADTVCSRSLDPIYLVACYIKWVETSWTYSNLWIIYYVSQLIETHLDAFWVFHITFSMARSGVESGIIQRSELYFRTPI